MRERAETRENIDLDGYCRSRPGRPKTVCYSPRKTAKTGSDGEAGQVGREAAERCAMLWKRVQTGRNQWKRVETSIRMGTGKVGKSCSRTPRKPEYGGEAAGNRWKGVETTIRMGTGKVGKSCSRTPRKPESKRMPAAKRRARGQ